MRQGRPTLASVLVTTLLLVAIAATIGLFVTPLGSRWFWPLVGVLAISAGAALAVPLRTNPPER